MKTILAISLSLFLFALILGDCGESTEATHATPTPEVEAAPQPYVVRGGALKFDDETLTSCTTFSLTVPVGGDTSQADSVLAHLNARATGEENLVAATDCTMGRNSTAWATCSIVDVKDSGLRLQVTTRYYDFSTVYGSDVLMRGCLVSTPAGEWSQVDRDSHEWRRANLEQATANLRRHFN